MWRKVPSPLKCTHPERHDMPQSQLQLEGALPIALAVFDMQARQRSSSPPARSNASFSRRSSSGPNLASSARKRASMSYGGYSRAGHAAGRAMGGRSPGRPSQGTKFTARRRGTSTAISAGASSTSTVWRLVSTPYGTQHDRGLGRNSGCAASRLLPAARLKENRQRNGAGSDTGNINYTRG